MTIDPRRTKPTTKSGAIGRTGKTTRNVRTATGRQPQQQEEDGRAALPKQEKKDQTTLFVCIGVGAVVLLGGGFMMMSGGGGSGRRAPDIDAKISKIIGKASTLQSAGKHAEALALVEEGLSNPSFRGSENYSSLENLAAGLRPMVNAERDSIGKVRDFKNKVEQAKSEGTAMKRAKEFWDECHKLLLDYGNTSGGKDLRDIREDLRRWVATESQSDWQKDYNQVKARVERDFLGKGNFSQAIREWRQFGETSSDPLLRSRLEQEEREINMASKKAAETLVASATSRESLEESIPLYNGTEGQQVINAKLRSMK